MFATDFISHQLLVPSLATSLFAIIAGVIKIFEYRGAYDTTVIVSIVTRFVIGIIYLTDVTIINDRVILIRFSLTMMMAAEVLRQGLKFYGKRYTRP